MVIVAVAATIVPQVATYGQLLASSFFLGLAGSSFAVGVGYVSGWATAERQGSSVPQVLWSLPDSCDPPVDGFPIASAARVCSPMTVASVNEFAVGGVKLFSYPTPEDPCIMIRTATGRHVAFSQKCTHLSCAVCYEKEGNRLECPC